MPDIIIPISCGSIEIQSYNLGLFQDFYLNTVQLNTIFQSVTSTILGLTGTDLNDFVRLEWPTEGAPAWTISQDRCFLSVIQENNIYDKQREFSYSNYDGVNALETTWYTKGLRVRWVFYGPNSQLYADMIRDGLFYQWNHDTLARNGIYLVPEIEAPVRAPELFAKQWWERVDISALFYELVVRNVTIPWVTDIPVETMVAVPGQSPYLGINQDITAP